MNYKKWIIAALLLIGIIGITTAYYIYNKPHAEVASMEVDHTVDATTLYASFDQNEKEANTEYLNDVIIVNGKLLTIEKSEDGGTTLIIDGGAMLGGVKCEMDSHSVHDLDSLEVGDPLKLKGICSGFLMDVIMVRCILLSNS